MSEPGATLTTAMRHRASSLERISETARALAVERDANQTKPGSVGGGRVPTPPGVTANEKGA